MNQEIRLFKPSVGAEELDAVRRVFDRGWLGLGGEVAAFESEFADYIGAPAALGVNSGTAALQLALEALGLQRGKKVLVNNLTFVASATVILVNGLVPVLVDCDPETLQLDVKDAARKVDKDTVAMVVVHFGGHPAPMEQVLEFASLHRLKVVEDCAHCVGGSYRGRKLGTWGDLGCFSFEEKKGMTTGDGGMIVACDAGLVEKIRPHRWLGIDKDTWRRRDSYTAVGDSDTRHWHYEVSVLGHKFNMNDYAACIGRVQLRKLDSFNARKREILERYLKALEGGDGVRPLLPYVTEGSAYWLFGVRTKERDRLIRHLKGQRIATGVHYMPVALHPLFAPYNRDLSVSNEIWKDLLTLPFHPELTNAQVDRVSNAVGEALSSV